MQNLAQPAFNFREISSFSNVTDFFTKHSQNSEFIKKVGVIGSGVMGSGIAGVLANSSVKVILLDVASKDPDNRNLIVQQAFDKFKAIKPAPLTSQARENFIQIGNLEEDLNLLNECDLIIEVIVERIEVKWQLYEKIIPHLKKEAIIASNTSTLQLKQLKQNLPETLKPYFLITHFFNPPRYMDLVELVTDKQTNPHVLIQIKNFITHILGKTIVECNDTPGFIANRIGCFFLELVVRKAITEKLNPVIIDHIFSKLFKLPGTGIFGLYDLIGHDVLKLISSSLIKNLPDDDLYKSVYTVTPFLDKMTKSGFIGRKSGGGFYKISDTNGKKEKKVILFDINNDDNDEDWILTYAAIMQSDDTKDQFSSVEELLNSDSVYGLFFKEVIFKFYYYLITLIPDVTDKIASIDQAMELGYSWKSGPFKLLANYIPGGLNWIIKEAKARSIDLPNSQNKMLLKSVEDLKSDSKLTQHATKFEIFSNDGGRLCSYENRLILSIESKMCCLNNEVFHLFLESINYAEKHKKDIYIYSSDSLQFSAGADLKFIIKSIENKDFEAINKFIKLGQQTFMKLKYSNINIISCARGTALGGGCEILLHSDFIIGHSELKAGLVEMGVGLIPGWGGVKEMFLRSKGNIQHLLKNLKNIIYQNKSLSADQFFADYSIHNYKIIMNRNDLLEEAYKLKLPKKIPSFFDKIIFSHIDLVDYFDSNKLDSFQIDILNSFQKIINLKTVTATDILEFEQQKFIELCKTPETLVKLKNIIG